jgi:MYXO-CTERM domain-containing protein
MIPRPLICIFFIAISLNGAPGLVAATLSFDFEEGAFGTNWFNLSTGADLDPDLGFSNAGEALQAGSWSLGPIPHGSRDAAHDFLHVRSAPFFLDGSGDLTFDLKGGTGGVLAPDLGTGVVSTGVQGVALTRVSNSERVLGAAATFRGTINTITWNQATIAPYANEAGETWTLDVYDTRSGSWGWFSMDTVSIPGQVVPEPSTPLFAALGILGLITGRRRRR